MLSTHVLQITDRSPYRVIRTRRDYLRFLNLRRLKARPDQTTRVCLKADLRREDVHESD